MAKPLSLPKYLPTIVGFMFFPRALVRSETQISFFQNLNSGRLVHFLQLKSLRQERFLGIVIVNLKKAYDHQWLR